MNDLAGSAHNEARHGRELMQHAVGMLPESQMEEFEGHLTTCPTCQARWERLASGSSALVDQHLPPGVIAAWPRRSATLEGRARDLVGAHLERCERCRSEIELLGYSAELPAIATRAPEPAPARRPVRTSFWTRAWAGWLRFVPIPATAALLLVASWYATRGQDPATPSASQHAVQPAAPAATNTPDPNAHTEPPGTPALAHKSSESQPTTPSTPPVDQQANSTAVLAVLGEGEEQPRDAEIDFTSTYRGTVTPHLVEIELAKAGRVTINVPTDVARAGQLASSRSELEVVLSQDGREFARFRGLLSEVLGKRLAFDPAAVGLRTGAVDARYVVRIPQDPEPRLDRTVHFAVR